LEADSLTNCQEQKPLASERNLYAAGAEQSIHAIQDTAKWLLGVFAALGAALLAGTQLTGFGQLGIGSVRFWVVVFCLPIALSSIGWAIWKVLAVIVTDPIDLDLLTPEELVFLRPLLPDGMTPATVIAQKRNLLQLLEHGRDEQFGAKSPTTESQVASEILTLQDTLIENMHASIRWRRTNKQALVARKHAFIGSTIAAIAILLGAWAANPPTVKMVTFPSPLSGTVIMNSVGVEKFERRLGHLCVATPVQVLILGLTGDQIDVVSVPTSQCRMIRFAMTEKYGVMLTVNSDSSAHALPATPGVRSAATAQKGS
jgi:hypothetical protein